VNQQSVFELRLHLSWFWPKHSLYPKNADSKCIREKSGK
jgi:hypothetical protein